MSAHNPFDGIYDDNPPASAVEAERQKSEPEAKSEIKPSNSTTYSLAFLRRQDKADLQKIAASRSLDTSGTRDQLVDRIDEAQRADKSGS